MRRWLTIIFVMVACGAVVIYETQASNKRYFMPAPLAGVKIVLDAGHGGQDGGAVSGEVIEKKINLAITLQLAKRLSRLGAEVVLTRTSDEDVISEHAPSEQFKTFRARKVQDIFLRKEIIEKEQPTLFLSIHANSIPNEKWRGAQVFYHEQGHPNSVLLAKSIQSSIREELQNTEREELVIKHVYLLKHAKAPAVLIETGFLSNAEERDLLINKKYQGEMVKAIASGVENYIKLNFD